MNQLLGTELTPQARSQALAAFVHRFTGDHIPRWSQQPQPNGRYCNVQFRDDAEWLAHTLFYVTKAGRIAEKPNYCVSTPTWPNGREFLNAPYRKES